MSKTTKWRMAKLPTPDEVALLLDKGIITKDEAREILISQETEEDRDKKSLQDEIKFLRELVQKLSNRTEIVRQIEYIQKPYIRYDWYEPYKFYCSGTSGQLYTTSGNTSISLTGASYNADTQTASYSLTSQEPSFTAIKTF